MKYHVVPRSRKVPDAELLADLSAVAKKLGCTMLSKKVYDDHGRFCACTFNNRFGSWIAALALVGIKPGHCYNVLPERVIAYLQRVAKIMGSDRLFFRDYKKHGSFTSTVLYRLFGNWQTAALAAGLAPEVYRESTDADLFDNLKNIWETLGRQPTVLDVRAPLSKFSIEPYTRRFGTFTQALLAFEKAMAEPGEIPDQPTPPISRRSWPHRRTSRTVNYRLRFLVLSRDDFRCCACGRSPATHRGIALQVDHKKPWRNGGETVLENLQTLCGDCNQGKSDLPWKAGDPK